MTNIAIFASGSGSNAENIINYFTDNNNVTINLIITNNKNAFVIERAKKLGVDCKIITKKDFCDSRLVLNTLKNFNINFIVLAGFLLLIPEYLIKNFNNKIINIHPALLPNYGGKGMYGMNVHNAIIKNKETQSGITIHYVNENYDEGNTIFQARCEINKQDTPEKLAEKIHKLEYKYFPKVIDNLLHKRK